MLSSCFFRTHGTYASQAPSIFTCSRYYRSAGDVLKSLRWGRKTCWILDTCAFARKKKTHVCMCSHHTQKPDTKPRRERRRRRGMPRQCRRAWTLYLWIKMFSCDEDEFVFFKKICAQSQKGYNNTRPRYLPHPSKVMCCTPLNGVGGTKPAGYCYVIVRKAKALD